MKITLSSADKIEFTHLVEMFNENLRSADGYNNIIFRHKKANSTASSLAMTLLKPESYLDNPYAKIVRPSPYEDKDWKLFYSNYAAYEGFVYDEISCQPDNYYQEKTQFGYFDVPFSFLAIQQDGKIWMSITPHEINTMAKVIQEAQGNVLTLGLGLGYFAFMASLRQEVKTVTIVEKDTTIISMFKRKILPFFPFKEKILIRKGDAFDFLKTSPDVYDAVFADLWHLPEDGLPLYLRLKPLEKRFPKAKFSYWVETSLLSLLRRAVIVLLQEEINGSADEDYDFAATESDLLVNRLHFLLKNRAIKTYGDIKALLSDASLREIAPLIEQ